MKKEEAYIWQCVDGGQEFTLGSDGTLHPVYDDAAADKSSALSGRVGLSEPFPNTPLEVVEQGTNPKDRLGAKKPNLHLVPSTAIVHCAKAMEDGARKYGPYNWRENKVLASVYVSAAERHIRQWFDSEDLAEDSGQHHLAHAMACLAILLDAEEGGNLKDDRPIEGETSALIKRLTETD